MHNYFTGLDFRWCGSTQCESSRIVKCLRRIDYSWVYWTYMGGGGLFKTLNSQESEELKIMECFVNQMAFPLNLQIYLITRIVIDINYIHWFKGVRLLYFKPVFSRIEVRKEVFLVCLLNPLTWKIRLLTRSPRESVKNSVLTCKVRLL